MPDDPTPTEAAPPALSEEQIVEEVWKRLPALQRKLHVEDWRVNELTIADREEMADADFAAATVLFNGQRRVAHIKLNRNFVGQEGGRFLDYALVHELVHLLFSDLQDLIKGIVSGLSPQAKDLSYTHANYLLEGLAHTVAVATGVEPPPSSFWINDDASY